MLSRGWNYDPNNMYCLGFLSEKRLKVFGHMTDDTLRIEFPQAHKYFHGDKS